METIFDHNPTDEELRRFGGRKAFEWAAKNNLPFSQDSHSYMIGMIYSMRGDRIKANEYWSKIEHKEMLSTLVQDCP